MTGLLDHACPRCGAATRQPYYGPCGTCRDELRTRLCGEQHDVATERFEPPLHVTPNAVALKE